MLPVVVNGLLKSGTRHKDPHTPSEVHCFRFSAKAGQTLVFASDARTIYPYDYGGVPSYMQLILILRDAKGTELAYADGSRVQEDPVLIYKVPADAEYLLEVRDAMYRGGNSFIYRLTMGALPYITGIYPMG